MLSKVCCSLCEQSFDSDDTVLELRKKRHEDHHDQTNAHGSNNIAFGKVDWRIEK